MRTARRSCLRICFKRLLLYQTVTGSIVLFYQPLFRKENVGKFP